MTTSSSSSPSSNENHHPNIQNKDSISISIRIGNPYSYPSLQRRHHRPHRPSTRTRTTAATTTNALLRSVIFLLVAILFLMTTTGNHHNHASSGSSTPAAAAAAAAASGATATAASVANALSSSSTSPATTRRPVAVIGATGRLGRLAVQELVDRGIPCRLLVRQELPSPPPGGTGDSSSSSSSVAATPNIPPPPSSLKDYESSQEVLAYFQSLPGVTLIQGDVGNVESLRTLLRGDDDGDDDNESTASSACSACLALWGATRRSKISDLWNHKHVADTDPTHAKQVNYQGVCNLLQACQETTLSSNSQKSNGNGHDTDTDTDGDNRSGGCRRIVRITGKGEDPTGFFSVLINTLGSMAKAWNYQGEQALRAAVAAANTNIEYTIVRPGVMSNEGNGEEPPQQLLQLADDGGDLPVSKIRYQDIAKLCVECLEYPNAANCTLTAMTAAKPDTMDGAEKKGDSAKPSTSSSPPPPTATSWGPLLAQVKPDRRTFPSDMLEQHYAAVRNVLTKGIGGVAVVVLAILVKVLGVA